jgi:Protein of unknown function (DUF3276)
MFFLKNIRNDFEKYTFVSNFYHSFFFHKTLDTVEFGKFSRGDRDDKGGSDRPRYGDRNDRGGDRNDRGGDRGGDRLRFGGGGDRNDRGGDRPRFGGGGNDRGGDRPRFGGGGGDRPRNRYGDRNDRGDRGDRGNFDREQDESVFSKKVRAGKRRTYFLDVRKTRGEDFFITITESTRKDDGFGYKRHKIFLYKEDFNRFAASLNEVVEHVKKDLMPNFDYEEFDRRQAEWDAQNRNEDEDEGVDNVDMASDDFADEDDTQSKKSKDDDDDVSW